MRKRKHINAKENALKNKDNNKRIFSACAPPPQISGRILCAPPDARAIFLHDDLLCNDR